VWDKPKLRQTWERRGGGKTNRGIVEYFRKKEKGLLRKVDSVYQRGVNALTKGGHNLKEGSHLRGESNLTFS